jgi:chemotaxis protein MotB
MAEKDTRPIIVKRIKKVVGGHHGGAWKIAYADFVTAMMAFFLLMWLLGSVDGGKLNGISEYFKMPLKTALAGGSSSGESSVILKGGGKDPVAESGLVKKGQPQDAAESMKEKEAALAKAEAAQMHRIKKNLDSLVDSNGKLRPFKKQMLIDVTSEGLRIQIVDEQNRPMFALSKAELQPYTRDILRELAPTLNSLPNKISLSGHTDSKPYAGGLTGYGNWELSADRANAARRVLIAGGMDEAKLIRVLGLSSAILLDKDNPQNPINRRISIIVLNKRAEEMAYSEGQREMKLPPPSD